MRSRPRRKSRGEQGYRLPAFEELQFAATAGAGEERLWYWGPDWDCEQSELSWFETCDGPRGWGVGVTGGPTGHSDYDLGVFDLCGNEAEWTATPWEPECYGFTVFSLAFGAQALDHLGINRQRPDPDHPDCWITSEYAASADGEHAHDYWNVAVPDDGFRCAADPSPQWADFTPTTEFVDLGDALPPNFYYDPDTGEKTEYDIPPRLSRSD
jgi:hypothetical protein